MPRTDPRVELRHKYSNRNEGFGKLLVTYSRQPGRPAGVAALMLVYESDKGDHPKKPWAHKRRTDAPDTREGKVLPLRSQVDRVGRTAGAFYRFSNKRDAATCGARGAVRR